MHRSRAALAALAAVPLSLACGGGDAPTAPDTQDPTIPPPANLGTWTAIASLPEIVEAASGAVHDGKIYIVGTASVNSPDSLKGRAYRFDPQAGSWERLPDPPRMLRGPGMAVHDGNLLVLGGGISRTSASGSLDILAWDDAQRRWTDHGALPASGGGMSASLTSGVLMIGPGGSAPASWILRTGSTTWESLPSPPFSVEREPERIKSLSPDAVGAWGAGLQMISRYLPASQQWETPIQTGASARFNCAVSTANRVHHLTSQSTSATHLVYDIAARTWDVAAPQPDSHKLDAICLSIGEKVYMIAGNDETGFNPKVTGHVYSY